MRRTHRGLTTVALLSLVGGSAFAQQAHAEGYEEVQQERDQQAQQQRGQEMLQREAEQGQQQADQRQQQADQRQQQADAQQQDAQQQRQQAAQQQAQQQNQLLQQAQADSVQLSALDADQVRALQQTLQQRGYYQGEIDGLVGPKTRTALRRFYNDRAQLAARGRILPDSAESLGMDAAQIERVRGQEAAEGTEFEQRTLRGEEPTQEQTNQPTQERTNQPTQERTNQPMQERTNQPMQEQNEELFDGEPFE